jgi:hypothetical protein
VVPSFWYWSLGQALELPVHVSAMSQTPVLARQTVPDEEYWQLEQQLSFESSQTAPDLNLQVVASQQALSSHASVPPQSQSSPASTMPFPHWLPVIVTTPRLSVRHVDWMLLRPMAEQMLPIVHSEKLVIDDEA